MRTHEEREEKLARLAVGRLDLGGETKSLTEGAPPKKKKKKKNGGAATVSTETREPARPGKNLRGARSSFGYRRRSASKVLRKRKKADSSQEA